jgi:phosphoribosylanthranilate isomerase
MKALQIKVCGITNISEAQTLDAMGVNYIGFIFYAPSKRYVLGKLQLAAIKAFKPLQAKKVGVFVNEPIESLVNTVMVTGLDMVQLHGDEDEAYYKTLRNRFDELGKVEANQEMIDTKTPKEIIKVFRVGDKMPAIESFSSLADYYLFDTDSQLYGGTGAHFNWELLKGNPIDKPYFLSGGIGPNDLGGIEVMQQTKAGKTLMALDVNSQFELAPGEKDLEKIKTFIHALI